MLGNMRVVLCCMLMLLVLGVRGLEVTYDLAEELESRVLVGNVAADSGLANTVNSLTYSLLQVGYPAAKSFIITETRGELYTNATIDRDSICEFQDQCVLNLVAVASNSDTGDFHKIKIYVNVIDINDNSPIFPKTVVSFQIIEDTAINFTYSLEGAVDLDTGINSVKRYEIPLHDSPFQAVADKFPDGRSMLKLILKQTLDREINPTHQIRVLAYDGGSPPNTGTLTVNISVGDINDNYPIFSKLSYNVTIMDDLPEDSLVVKTFARDKDEGPNGEVQYRLKVRQSEDIFQTFYMNTTSGEIFLKKSLISGSQESYKILIEATDKGNQPLISQSQVFVRVQDNHNNFPVINVNVLSGTDTAEVSEHASQGTVVAHIAVKDPDTGANGLVKCDVISQYFKIQKFEENEYKVVVFASLNREMRDSYEVTVSCHDAGSPPRETNSTFPVIVVDENDNPPRFDRQIYYATVSENNNVKLSLLTVSATDDDIGINAEIKFSVSNEVKDKLSINENSGVLILNQALDREVQNQVSFYVFATDSGNVPLTGTATVIITVKDMNDNTPTYPESVWKFAVPENLDSPKVVGFVTAFDKDEGINSEVRHYLMSSSGHESPPFEMKENGTLMVTRSLDRETVALYDLQIMAMDKGSPARTGFAFIKITVEDRNDNKPEFIFPSEANRSITVPLSTTKNKGVTTLTAKDKDVDKNAQLKYYTEDQNMTDIFIINSASGEVILARSLDSDDLGLYVFKVKVHDLGDIHLTAEETLLINVIADSVADDNNFSRYYVIAISMSTVTLVLAIVIIVAIYLLRKVDNKRRRYNSGHSAITIVTKEAENPDVYENSPPLHKEVFYPPGYDLGSRQFFPIDRSISVQIPPTIPEADPLPKIPSDPTLWEGCESVNENERNRNQLMTLQYHQSLMRIQSVKRSNSTI
ncbi:protocadherin-11 X-linked-like [Saccostrea cucullata]|uniref:protocadherin-11 X-linked-like n=1 Tax=Saccostrea cuccullata TaxID=36930 RepID=UPI002ED0715D